MITDYLYSVNIIIIIIIIIIVCPTPGSSRASKSTRFDPLSPYSCGRT